MRLDRSRRYLLEKSPPNAARTRWLQRHFENAHFIALVRNGYAVAEGIRRKAEPRHLKGGWPIEACAYQWQRSNEILVEDAAHLERVLWVRYEELTEDPPRELARILTFLGLSAADLPAPANRSWKVHEREQAVGNLNRVNLAQLSPDDVSTVSRVAAPMLRHFGYEVLDPGAAGAAQP